MASTINGTSTGNGGLISTGDDSGILNIQTNETTAVTIDASQRVGIGTTSPSNILDIVSASNPTIRITDTTNNCYTELNATDTVGYVGTASNHAFAFTTNNTERMRIDSSGNLGVGTSSPNTRIQSTVGSNGSGAVVGLRLQNVGTSAGDGAKILFTAGTSTNGAGISSTGVALDSADLRFDTGGSNERMRILSDGAVIVGATSNPGGGFSQFVVSGPDTVAINNTVSGTGSTTAVYFKRNATGTGTISVTGSNTAYNTSSDYRLKENIAPMTGALAKVAQLKPVTYKWKLDSSDGEGFIAHELAEVCPHAVSGEKDAVDEDGNPKYQGIDTSFLVATLTAAIQELKAINDTQAETINALTARIVALESKGTV